MKLPALPDTLPHFCSHSNVTANLSDGVLISFSALPQKKEILNSAKVNEILSNLSKELLESVPQPILVAPPKSPKGRKSKRDEEQKQGEVLRKEPSSMEAKRLEERCQEIEGILRTRESMKNVYVTTPDGVRLSYKHGVLVNDHELLDENVKTFLVKQERIANETEEVTLENCDQVKELYRCISSDGLLLKVLALLLIVWSCVVNFQVI